MSRAVGCRCTAEDDPELGVELEDRWGETAWLGPGLRLGRVELACGRAADESAVGRATAGRLFSSSIAQLLLASSSQPTVRPRPLRNLRRLGNPDFLVMAGLLSLPGPPGISGLSDSHDRRGRVRNRVFSIPDCKLQARQEKQQIRARTKEDDSKQVAAGPRRPLHRPAGIESRRDDFQTPGHRPGR